MEHTENAWWKCANPLELILMSIFLRRPFRFLLKMSRNGWNLGLNTSKKLGFWRENSKFLAEKILKIINGAKIPENYLNFSTKIQTKLKKSIINPQKIFEFSRQKRNVNFWQIVSFYTKFFPWPISNIKKLLNEKSLNFSAET